MNREQLLRELRTLWSDGKFLDFKKKFMLGYWLLTPEDLKKIEEVTGVKKPGNKENAQMLIDYAVKEMGAKIVE